MNYDINRPWLTLDPWQKEYIFETDPNQDCFLLCTRQGGKTTAMSEKAVELCINHFKKGEYVLINSITEKQGYHMLAKAQVYAKVKYSNKVVWKGKDKPTKHVLNFKNGTGILCYAAGDTGEGLRGYTIKKLMIDEGSRMSEEYFIAVGPMLSVIGGSTDIASTPFGKKHKDGSPKYFYLRSLDDDYKKFYVPAKDCPRHDKEFLEKQKEKLSKLAYAQEYEAIFTDELRRLFDDDMIKKICTLKRIDNYIINQNSRFYLGCDIAGQGKAECTYEVFEKTRTKEINQIENITEKENMTTDTTKKILTLNKIYPFGRNSIGVDDMGVGYGVWSELMDNNKTKRKVVALNNASRDTDRDGTKHKKILKEEMYINLQVLMEQDKIKLLDDEEVKASLSSIQHDEGKIFGSYSHIAEGIIRAVWLAKKDIALNIYVY